MSYAKMIGEQDMEQKAILTRIAAVIDTCVDAVGIIVGVSLIWISAKLSADKSLATIFIGMGAFIVWIIIDRAKTKAGLKYLLKLLGADPYKTGSLTLTREHPTMKGIEDE